MLAHSPNNDCPCWQSLLGVVATNLPGADLNSSAGPKGGGQDARNKVKQGTAFRRLATKADEKRRLILQIQGMKKGVAKATPHSFSSTPINGNAV
jgi:hypothetical protein